MSDQLQRLLDQLIATGKADPKMLDLIKTAANNPSQMKELFETLKTFSPEQPLNIADYYTEGDGSKFTLQWPIGAGNPLARSGMDFGDLDRKTQFFTLFSEWQRRETEGMMALTNGELDEAEATFHECLERAVQIRVDELRARSYECLMRAAERRGDQGSVSKWLEKAQEVRT